MGDPARPVTFEPSWRTKAVTELARKMYEQRRFDKLSKLADLLEAAGCRHPAILHHCRASGDHYRGCWIIDLILDKR